MDICNKHHSQYNVLLLDRAHLTEFRFFCDFHLYKEVWLPILGEC